MISRFFALTLGAVACLMPSLHAVNLAGSDLLNGAVAASITEQTKDVPGGVKLILDGSLMGEKHLRDGSADVALLLLLDKSKIKEIADSEWEAVPVAYQTVVVAVNKRNGLQQIDMPTLAGIYGRLEATDLRHWNNVKGSGIDAPIFPVSTRYDLGMVSPLFRNVVLKNGDYRATVSFQADDIAAKDYVNNTTNAIALLALPPEDDLVKILPVVAPGRDTAYAPTASNFYNGDYPLAIPMYLVFPKGKQQVARPLFSPLLGDVTAEMLKKNGFVPAPKNIRTNAIQRLDKAP